MDDKSRVIVGIDGSESSRGALRWALAEALVLDVPLEVLHASRTPMIFVPNAYASEFVEMGRMNEAALQFIDRELDAVAPAGTARSSSKRPRSSTSRRGR